MNKTELQLIYTEIFHRDCSRTHTRAEIIEALTTGVALDGDGVDGLREFNLEVIRKYFNTARYQLDCDMFCISCPQGIVADCYLGFRRNYK